MGVAAVAVRPLPGELLARVEHLFLAGLVGLVALQPRTEPQELRREVAAAEPLATQHPLAQARMAA
jgi:hypothetical protein